MNGEFYESIKLLLIIGALHSSITMMLTEWLKSAFGLGGLGARLFPILWSVTVTIIVFPHTMASVGLAAPDMGPWISLLGLVMVGVIGAGGAFAIYNLWDVMRYNALNALKAKLQKWGDK